MTGTIEKRINVTPSPTVGPLLRELSRLTGKGPATLIREMLDEAVPALVETVAALKLIKRRPEAAQAALARVANRAQMDLAQAQLDLDTAIRKKPGRKPGKKPGRGAAKTG